MMKKILILTLFVSATMQLFAQCPASKYGIVPVWPQQWSFADKEAWYADMSQRGMGYSHSIYTWQDLDLIIENAQLNTHIDYIQHLKDDYGFKFHLLLRNPSLTYDALPAEYAGMTYEDDEMAQAFYDFCIYLVDNFANVLDYLTIGGEADEYFELYPNQLDEYVAILSNVADYIHTNYPNIKFATTLTLYHGVLENSELFQQTKGFSDMVSVTYWPINSDFTVMENAVELIPQTILDLISAADGKPIIIKEAGLPSSEIIGSSEQMQVEFLEGLVLNTMHIDQIEIVGWDFLADYNQAAIDYWVNFQQIYTPEFREYIGTLGLMDTLANEKPAYELYLNLLETVCEFNLNSIYDSIYFDQQFRTYLVHKPANYIEREEIPLLVALHGGFGNAYNLQDQSQLSIKADEENFMVVYPEGVSGQFGISSWNAGWCCGYASSNIVDDVGFINALLDTLIDKYSIDTTRIYATGISNGGFMSYRLACELSDRIAAIAPVAASMSMPNCNPARPVPIISFHSYLDTNVPYLGGVGTGTSGHYNPPQDSVLNAWSGKNICTNTQDTIVDNAEYTKVLWTDCNCGTEISYYITTDGGHSWHGGNPTQIGDPVSEYINANDLMWEFFQQHTLNCTITRLNKPSSDSNFEIYPNPVNNILSIKFPESTSGRIKILDITGKQLIEKSDIENIATLNISSFKTGIYIIEIQTDSEVFTTKIIKE